MVIARTTELNAINTMLTSIGSQPVNSLASTSADVAVAADVLNEVLREVLSQGWHFNTEREVEYIPDGVTNIITVSDNVIHVDDNRTLVNDVVLRGAVIYDLVAKADNEWDGIQKFDTVYLLEFEECSQACRQYVAVRAARLFQDRMKGSVAHHRFAEVDEVRALAAFRDDDARQADLNLRNSDVGYGIIGNRRSVARRLRSR